MRHGAGGFLQRLARDKAGNVLAIVAFSLFPLLAMIGSGIDVARGYMAQDRLQQACDAGALAGRRLLNGSVLTPEVQTEATNYLNFNFPQGTYQTEAFTPVITVPKTGVIRITAQTKMPNTIMRMFGFPTLQLSTTCSATQDFVSTDIMLVVDMSGSMNCTPGNTSGGSCNEREQSGSKMQALRDAAESLYDTLKPAQDQLHNNNLRLRFGFVPYNATVNVGKLVYAKNSSYIRKSNDYQTRVRGATTTSYTNQSQCNQLNGSYNGWYGICTHQWYYKKDTLDLSTYVTGASTTVPTWTSGTAKWAGCIEERKTDNSLINGGTSTTAPSSAWDLDINMIPSSDDSRWAPWWPEVVMDRDSYNQYTAARYCASEASRLKEYYNDKASFVSYLDNLVPLGNTYHDIGMIWGARFLSPDGIFKSASPITNNQLDPDNPKNVRGFSVRKYLIFMTDGDMAPVLDGYSSYGVEERDRRVTGTASTSTQRNRHLQRFRMACNAAKSQNIEVWVIAFATSLTSDMQNCASDPKKAAGISNTADLIAKFKEIGSKIGSLRLDQ